MDEYTFDNIESSGFTGAQEKDPSRVFNIHLDDGRRLRSYMFCVQKRGGSEERTGEPKNAGIDITCGWNIPHGSK